MRPSVEQSFRQSTRSRPILDDLALASSNAERALICEKRRCAAGVQEDDILVVAPAPLADQGDQAREAFARIDRIERKRLETAGKPDRFDGGFVRDAVGRAGMSRDDFYACFVEVGRFSRERHDIAGGVVLFVVLTSVLHGLFTPWLAPKFPKFFRHGYEPLFFNASLSLAEKIAKWRERPTTSVQLVTSELMLALLAAAVVSMK